MMQNIHIDIVSDVVCPWCIIGYKQLEAALRPLKEDLNIELQWHPFELNPGLSEDGENLREHLARKLGSTPRDSSAVRERLTSLGKELGFAFDFFDEMRVVNTFRAHQLLHWAQEYDQRRQTALKLALFEAHFGARKNVNDPDTLIQLAAQVGLPPEEAEEVLRTGRYAQSVRQDQQRWLDKEIHAVPAFIFDDRYSVLGAQNADTFRRVLDKVRRVSV